MSKDLFQMSKQNRAAALAALKVVEREAPYLLDARPDFDSTAKLRDYFKTAGLRTAT